MVSLNHTVAVFVGNIIVIEGAIIFHKPLFYIMMSCACMLYMFQGIVCMYCHYIQILFVMQYFLYNIVDQDEAHFHTISSMLHSGTASRGQCIDLQCGVRTAIYYGKLYTVESSVNSTVHYSLGICMLE